MTTSPLLKQALWPTLLFIAVLLPGCPCPPFCPPTPNIVTPGNERTAPCECDGPCFFEVQGTLLRSLRPNEELFVAVRPIDDAAPRYFIQFGEKTVNETFWTAQAQIGSGQYPPESGDRFEIWAIVVDTTKGRPPVDPVPALSAEHLPGLLAVSDMHTLSVDCQSRKKRVLEALTNHPYWHLYSPFRESAGTFVSEAQIHTELQMLYDSGARGLVTYEMMNGVEVAPRIAKDIGFKWVIAGIFWWTNGVANGQTDSTLEAEKAAVDDNIEWIDGIVIGNEGLLESDAWNQPRYTLSDLERELRAMKAKYPDRPVTTAEATVVYEQYPHLVSDGRLTDFVFPNIHPWWGGFRDPAQGVNNLLDTLGTPPFSERGDRAIVLHESWWPSETEGQDEEAQVAYFRAMLDARVVFCWGETVDQPWKAETEGPVGAHWGLWHYDKASDTYQPKKVVALIKARSR